MSEAFRWTKKLELELEHVRWRHAGLDSAEEARLLDQLDALWWQMTDEERQTIDAMPSRSLIRSEPEAPTDLMDVPTELGDVRPHRRLAESA